MWKEIQEAVAFIQQKTSIRPEAGIVLGTGLGDFVEEIQITESLHYQDIPHFPVSTVKGHAGKFLFGHIGHRPVVAMQGRFHFYEGYTLQEVSFPIRVMRFLGADTLFLSNASGGVNPAFKVGDLMIIRDHINLMGTNPLLGKNEDELGPRFPDMSAAYDRQLINKAMEVATKAGLSVQQGVYAAVTGPVYETPAEYRYIRIIGADAVGMSTVPETIVARHMDMRVFAISVITDLGLEGHIQQITHDEVIREARAAEPRLARIIKDLILAY